MGHAGSRNSNSRTAEDFDEYQALQMLDEDVVKRGVSDRSRPVKGEEEQVRVVGRKMRSFPVQLIHRAKARKDRCHICQCEYETTDKVRTAGRCC